MSQEKSLTEGSYTFGFIHQGAWGLVQCRDGHARIELADGVSPVWDENTVPAPVALSILKARLSAARDYAKSLSTQVSRETREGASRKFVQVAECFDASQLSLASEAPTRGTEHVFVGA